jgi:hypothetical protein
MYMIRMVSKVEMIMPISGARRIKAAITAILLAWTAANVPALMMAAPANPPIKVCDEEEGIPNHQVARFHTMAAINPEKITGNVTNSGRTVLETVLAIPNSPMTYLAMKKAIRLKLAAQSTALNGVRTLVETIVAMELAASWKPLM